MHEFLGYPISPASLSSDEGELCIIAVVLEKDITVMNAEKGYCSSTSARENAWPRAPRGILAVLIFTYGVKAAAFAHAFHIQTVDVGQ